MSQKFAHLPRDVYEGLRDVSAASEDIYMVATGSELHIYQGGCPDETNSYYGRDNNCPVCNALLEYELATRRLRAALLAAERGTP